MEWDNRINICKGVILSMSKVIELNKTIKLDGMFRKCVKFNPENGVAMFKCSIYRNMRVITSYDVVRCRYQESSMLPKNMGGGMSAAGWFSPNSKAWGCHGWTYGAIESAEKQYAILSNDTAKKE